MGGALVLDDGRVVPKIDGVSYGDLISVAPDGTRAYGLYDSPDHSPASKI